MDPDSEPGDEGQLTAIRRNVWESVGVFRHGDLEAHWRRRGGRFFADIKKPNGSESHRQQGSHTPTQPRAAGTAGLRCAFDYRRLAIPGNIPFDGPLHISRG